MHPPVNLGRASPGWTDTCTEVVTPSREGVHRASSPSPEFRRRAVEPANQRDEKHRTDCHEGPRTSHHEGRMVSSPAFLPTTSAFAIGRS